MTFKLRKVNWKNEKEKHDWIIELMKYGNQYDYIITSIVDDKIKDEVYLGHLLNNQKHNEFNDLSNKMLNWIKENYPEILI
jgi:hypothetical protein